MVDGANKSKRTVTRRALITANIQAELPDRNVRIPVAQNTVRLASSAMACEFTMIFNSLSQREFVLASEILETVHDLESQYTVYRESSELVRLNQSAGTGPFQVEENLYWLLKQSIEIAMKSQGTYNPLTHPIILLWRDARNRKCLPEKNAITKGLRLCQLENIHFDDAGFSIELKMPEMCFNLGSIGKGYAIDVLAGKLKEAGIVDFLIHAGQSSLYASGKHGPYDGWPVGISHPNLANRFIGTILLSNEAMSTSGSGVQFYRIDGKKYGHILDPRTGMPAESSLSSMIFHPRASVADALSTASYVAGPDLIESVLGSFPESRYILLVQKSNPHEFEIISHGLDEQKTYWSIPVT